MGCAGRRLLDKAKNPIAVALGDPKAAGGLERAGQTAERRRAVAVVQVEQTCPMFAFDNHIVGQEHSDWLAVPASEDSVADTDGLRLDNDLDRQRRFALSEILT